MLSRNLGFQTTPEMRSRIRELAERPSMDDHDRAVLMLLDDFARAMVLLAAVSDAHRTSNEKPARISDDLRVTLGGVATPIMGGDNLAIVLAGYFEPHIEDEELDNSGTWKQGAIDAADEILDAIHSHYAALSAA